MWRLAAKIRSDVQDEALRAPRFATPSAPGRPVADDAVVQVRVRVMHGRTGYPERVSTSCNLGCEAPWRFHRHMCAPSDCKGLACGLERLRSLVPLSPASCF